MSALKVASFPWDPQPEPQRQPPTVPSNARDQNDLVPAVSAPQEHVNFSNVPVKSERGYEPPVSSYPAVPGNSGYAGGYNGEIAQQRAHALITQRLQGQPNMPHPQHHGVQHPVQQQQQHQQQHQQHPQHLQHPQHPQHQQHQQQHQHQQQQRMMAAQQQQRPPPQMQQRPPQGHVYTSQTDGAGDSLEDWNALKAARAAEGEQGRIAADQFMRARVDALAARQDSGLMMPLNQMPKGRKRKAATRVLQVEDADRASSSTSAPGPARFDGEDDDEKVNDSDAINSDLDDPEDDSNNGDDSDDETMDYMLCTYDKVQRVKNKWKCTLKDGILTTNKKE